MREKLPVCEICLKRKVSQQEWKTDEEKKVCLTCKVVLDYLETLAEVSQRLLFDKGIPYQLKIVLESYDSKSAEERLLDAVFGRKRLKIVK